MRTAQNHKSPAKWLKACCAAERLGLADNPVRTEGLDLPEMSRGYGDTMLAASNEKKVHSAP